MAGRWAGRYLVAGRACYRIEREEGDHLVLTILAGSTAVRGRTVRVATSNAAANVALGIEQLWEVEPAWVGRGLLDGNGGDDDGDHGGESAGSADAAAGG